jgi:hypothetical protein
MYTRVRNGWIVDEAIAYINCVEGKINIESIIKSVEK